MRSIKGSKDQKNVVEYDYRLQLCQGRIYQVIGILATSKSCFLTSISCPLLSISL